MHPRHSLFAAVIGLFLCLADGRGQVVTNVIDRFHTNSYPNDSITNEWSNWFGGAFQSLSLDPAMDANTNPASGSMKIAADFPVATDQFEVWNGINGFSQAIRGFQFTNFQCDIRFAPGSATNSSGTFGNLEFGVPTPGYGQNYFGSLQVSAANTNWVHVSIPLNANSNTNLQKITGLLIHIWGAGLVGPSTLWVDNIQFVGTASTGTARINYNDTRQRIDGFGASSAWMSGTLATSTADLLFSTNTGVGLSLLRTRIAPDGTTWEGNIAQQAQARGARIWSTPWSPPVAYKDTNTVNGGHFVSSAANFQGYANLLAKYVANLKTSHGIQLHALSIQNEPDMSIWYESCIWTAQQFHDFLPYLDAALTASNVGSTKIMLPESMHWQFSHATNAMNDATTSNLVDILAGHNYGSSAAPVTQFGTPCPKTLWETEHYFGSDDGITNGLALAEEIHSFMTVAEANAYHYWWLTGSGNGSLANDPANPAKRLYTMGNYSRFIRPEFYRVGVTNTSTALVSAFKDPASSNFVIVAANNSAYPVNQTFTLTNFPAVGPLRQWVTSASEPLANRGGAISVTNGTFVAVLPAWTVTTYVSQPPGTNLPGVVQQPADQVALPGENVCFSVQADGGTVGLYYQWRFNGTNNLPGATNASLWLAGVDPSDAGYYSVIVTNPAGSVTSAVATLTVSTDSHFVLKADDTLGSSSFNAVGNWTNSATGALAPFAPTNGYAYRTGPFTLRTPAAAGNYSFAGSSLIVSAGGSINIKGGGGNTITFSNLVLSGTINDSINPNQVAVVAGHMTVTGAGSLNTQAALSDARGITNNLTLSGSGALTNLGLGTGPGFVVYNGSNAAFTGPLRVISNTTLLTASQASLGGNPDVFRADQLFLDNGTLQPTASFVMNNTNSGVTIGPNGGTFNVGAGIALAVSNPVAGGGKLIKTGAGVLTLAGTNPFAGSLTVSNGSVVVAGGMAATASRMDARAGTTLDLTAMNGPFSVSNQITLAGNLVLALNRTNADNPVLLAGDITFGGTLTVSNQGPALAADDTFTVFSAGNYSGAFTAISPATPGAGLFWDTSQIAVNGTLTVFSVSYPGSLTGSVSNGSFVLSWPESHRGWTLQSQTNLLGAGLGTNWVDLPGSAQSNHAVVPMDGAPGSAFFRLRQ